jgi:hypothetical protein
MLPPIPQQPLLLHLQQFLSPPIQLNNIILQTQQAAHTQLIICITPCILIPINHIPILIIIRTIMVAMIPLLLWDPTMLSPILVRTQLVAQVQPLPLLRWLRIGKNITVITVLRLRVLVRNVNLIVPVLPVQRIMHLVRPIAIVHNVKQLQIQQVPHQQRLQQTHM